MARFPMHDFSAETPVDVAQLAARLDRLESTLLRDPGVSAIFFRGTPLRTAGAVAAFSGDGILHGLPAAPRSVIVTPSVAGVIATVLSIGATSFLISLVNHDGTTPGTQTVYWQAEL